MFQYATAHDNKQHGMIKATIKIYTNANQQLPPHTTVPDC